MKITRPIFLFFVSLVFSGCATNGLTPSFSKLHTSLKKIEIIPPDVVVGSKEDKSPEQPGSASLILRDEDTESIYKASLADDIKFFLEQKGYVVSTKLLETDKAKSAEFSRDYLAFLRDYEYASHGKATFLGSGDNRVVNVLKPLTPLVRTAEADAYIFISMKKVIYRPPSNTERTLALALFGALLVDAMASYEISLIDPRTGELVWKDSVTSSSDNFFVLRSLFRDLPPAVISGR